MSSLVSSTLVVFRRCLTISGTNPASGTSDSGFLMTGKVILANSAKFQYILDPSMVGNFCVDLPCNVMKSIAGGLDVSRRYVKFIV